MAINHLTRKPLNRFDGFAEACESWPARHTIGRISALFRSVIHAIMIPLYILKGVGRAVITALSFNQLHKITPIFSFQNVKRDLDMSLLHTKNMIDSFTEIIVAPAMRSVRLDDVLVKSVKYLFGGDYTSQEQGIPDDKWEKTVDNALEESVLTFHEFPLLNCGPKI